MKICDYMLLLCLTGLATPPAATAAEPTTPKAHSASDITAIINTAARQHQVDAALIRAVIKVESNFDPNAVSRAGAIGLMQLLPRTAADYGVDSRDALFNPGINVDAGTRHLKRLLKKYRNISRALTAYNAGEGNAAGFHKTGAYIETRKYTVSVIKYYQQYKQR